MHYRNGREAKNGDKIVSLNGWNGIPINAIGILFDAVPGNDYCNGSIAPVVAVEYHRHACAIACTWMI